MDLSRRARRADSRRYVLAADGRPGPGVLRLSPKSDAGLRLGQQDLFEPLPVALPNGLGPGTVHWPAHVAQGTMWQLGGRMSRKIEKKWRKGWQEV